MSVEIGTILKGKVTGITKFGAFILLETGDSGMVHISEIASGYVTEIKDHLSDNQEVLVKVISVDDKNRINLSIKQAAPTPPQEKRPRFTKDKNNDQSYDGNKEKVVLTVNKPQQKPSDAFEDMLSKFKQQSEDRYSDTKAGRESRRSYGKRSSK